MNGFKIPESAVKIPDLKGIGNVFDRFNNIEKLLKNIADSNSEILKEINNLQSIIKK